MELKIGILLPRSDMFPTLAMDLLNGLKLVLRNLVGNSYVPKFIVEGIGNASDDSLLRTAEKMILQEDVDITISFCSAFKLREMVNIFNAYKKPLIHMDLGGRIITKDLTSPYVIHHTLNLWQSAYTAGVYAAKTFGKKAALTASFYDGGYHLSVGFVQGFTDNGGTIVYNYVGPMDYKSESFDTMIEGIKDADPDVVFALFSHNEAVKVFEKITDSKINETIPFMSIPLMTDEVSHTKNYNLDNVFSIASWAFDEETPQMETFLSDYKTSYTDNPNIFSLLGYEVGLILSNCIDDGYTTIPALISECLKTRRIESPRGTLSFNDINASQVTTYKLRKFNFDNIQYHNTVIETIDISKLKNLHQQFLDIPLAGWRNPYICT